jgi:hypothetical protein
MKWTNDQKPTSLSEIKPLDWEPPRLGKFAPFIRMCLLLLSIALLLFLLSGCSKAVSITPMPPPPANLASDCPQLENPPEPLLDPERVIWEITILTAYADCAARHRLAIEAWRGAVNTAQ